MFYGHHFELYVVKLLRAILWSESSQQLSPQCTWLFFSHALQNVISNVIFNFKAILTVSSYLILWF